MKLINVLYKASVPTAFLTDKHMHAAHQLLLKQFPYISGLESTLLCQTYGFAHVTSDGMK